MNNTDISSNLNFDLFKISEMGTKPGTYPPWPLNDLKWPWRINLTPDYQTNFIIKFLDPKNLKKCFLLFCHFPFFSNLNILIYIFYPWAENPPITVGSN